MEPAPIGYFYPDIYRVIAARGGPSTLPLARSSKVLYNTMLPQICNSFVTVPEVVRWILSPYPPSAITFYSLSPLTEGSLGIIGSDTIQIGPEYLTTLNSLGEEYSRDPQRVTQLVNETVQKYPWLRVDDIYELFGRRKSCDKKIPHYALRKTWEYLQRLVESFLSVFDPTSEGSFQDFNFIHDQLGDLDGIMGGVSDLPELYEKVKEEYSGNPEVFFDFIRDVMGQLQEEVDNPSAPDY